MMDHHTRSALNFFANSPIDRLTTQRKDEAWLAEQLAASTTRFVPVWRAKNLLTKEAPLSAIFFSPTEAQDLLAVGVPIFLGQLHGQSYFALSLPPAREVLPHWLTELGEFHDLRARWEELDNKEDSILVFAKAMGHWHEEHQFCGRCGGATTSKDAGFMRLCLSEACGKQHFPRTDSAIIVLINSEERCLLARQPSWPPDRYSVIAGFVEPGESLEDAVKREAYEETGLTVHNIHYHSSQPWPFPSSLMLGYMAEAITTEIELIDQELERAYWFSREDIVTKIKNGTLKVPPPVSISHQLLETWFDQGDQGRLKALLAGLREGLW